MKETTDLALDVALSGFLTARSGLEGAARERFGEAVRALTRAMRDGHTCALVEPEQRRALEGCRLVSERGDRPLVLSGERLYLARFFRYESRLAEQMRALAAVGFPLPGADRLLDRCFPAGGDEPDWQREAARLALTRGLCIISGGPGTGKTTTVVKIAGLLLAHYGTGLRVALAAPTGKAAMRLRESVAGQISLLPFPDAVREAIPTKAQTLHRLLGVRRFSPVFRHNRERPVPAEVIIVDEASMVDLALMSKLVDALGSGARLILLGDRNQLASVESGAVLADCIAALGANVVELQTAWRFNEAISAFAARVNRGDGDGVWEMLGEGRSASIGAAGNDWLERAGAIYARYLERVHKVRSRDDFGGIFALFNEFRVLCALKSGPRGVRGINDRLERFLAQAGFDCGRQVWYAGRPVIVTRNDYALGLFNGDIGICLPDPEAEGERAVWFEREDGGYHRCLPVRLPACETVFAMTVHKSQGSEFDEVLVVLPQEDSPVLCRELLYTAVTRARRRVTVLADQTVCTAAVQRRIVRHSGLAERLARPHDEEK